jgi:pimeloyl-ACP methyl ester carboxylesterase
MITRRTFSAALVAGVATALSGRPRSAMAAVPARNVVLVHGAFADGSSWSEVIGRLQAAGLKATAVQNPLTSLADDVACTQRILAQQDGPTVLVGHSWAGAVISQTGLDPKVSALVYVAAWAPEAGEDTTALSARFPTAPAIAGIVESGGFEQLGEQAFLTDFAGGVDRARARELYAAQGPIADTLFSSVTTVAAWHVKPSWYSVSKQDRTISPDMERFLANRMRAQTIEVDASHLAMITHPQEIADLILNAAGRSG